MMFSSKYHQCLGRNNELFKPKISGCISKNGRDLSFGRKKLFRRFRTRYFACCAKIQKLRKSKFGIFYSFNGYKVPVKFREASCSSFAIFPPHPTRYITPIAQLEEG